ncbi:MAG: glutathione S-transferase family protein [Rubrivivax sp.]
MNTPLALNGSPGSPYTRKMLALLRYRRLPYRLITGRQGLAGVEPPKPRLLPTFYLPDASGTLRAVTDSTPIIRRLEREHVGREVLPADPALAMLDALIEDFGDEWLTKAMFHYRWHYTADIQKSSRVLPNWFGGPVDDAQLATMGTEFSERQIGRLRYVGSTAQTASVIERGYQRLIAILDRHFAKLPFLFGQRPGAADFALYGQLTQLANFDPTPMALTTSAAPRVVAWVHSVEDLSGLEPGDADWLPIAQLPATLRELMVEIGRLYAPLLLANAQALQAGEASFSTVIDEHVWQQQAFAYQAKCLQWLRAQHQALPRASRTQFDAMVDGTGCEKLFG